VSSSPAPATVAPGSATASGSKSASAPSTTAPRSSTGGGINATVPARTITTAPPVPLKSPASFGGKVSAFLASIKAINATAQGVGEISGPALQVTFTITNGSSNVVDLGSVTANLQDAAGTPSVSMIGPPAAPFHGSVAPGKSASGVYVFSLAKNHVNPVSISLSYTTAAPVVLFVGNAQ
jgi:hypothetical protein